MSKDDGNSYDGRIWCRDDDRDRVNDLKRGGETQADVLERVLDFYDEHDPSDASGANAAHAADVDALADAVAERVDALADAVAERVSVTAEVDPDAVAAALAERIDVDGADPATIAKATADEVETRLR